MIEVRKRFCKTGDSKGLSQSERQNTCCVSREWFTHRLSLMLKRCSKIKTLKIENLNVYFLRDKCLTIDTLNESLGSASVGILDVGNVANCDGKLL